ncbi:hypothetical protein UY3_18606 [Chelonia mydas]|uniref:Uncharacterized protein n=1 Tax=Chelonia mydas TaxID=8469 RepID=M7AX75_CHEMY|nr:hypothetical protein UY3_18606 [Chelonia mydas]
MKSEGAVEHLPQGAGGKPLLLCCARNLLVLQRAGRDTRWQPHLHCEVHCGYFGGSRAGCEWTEPGGGNFGRRCEGEEEAEDDSEVRDTCCQELFSTMEQASQSELSDLGEVQTEEEAPGSADRNSPWLQFTVPSLGPRHFPQPPLAWSGKPRRTAAIESCDQPNLRTRQPNLSTQTLQVSTKLTLPLNEITKCIHKHSSE